MPRPAFLALTLALSLLACACATTVPEATGPIGSRISLSSRPKPTQRPYRPARDGSGFSTEPFDQPDPVPNHYWPGERDVCEWVSPDLARAVGGTGEVTPTATGCNVSLGGSELLELSAFGPYERLTDSTQFIRPVTVAGLQARERAFDGQGKAECTLDLNTRSLTAIDVTAWNHGAPDRGDPEHRCVVARSAAEMIARRFVPPARGAPW